VDAERYVFEPLGNQTRAAFSCGDEQLDRYFQERAGQDQRRGIASCFVLIDRDAPAVAGFYTLSTFGVVASDLPESFTSRLPRYPILPGILLGRLAVDRRSQGAGLGRRLLVDALRRARDATAQVGAVVMVVDAKQEAVAHFYEGFGFVRFRDQSLRLFLPFASIRNL
jgi:GNAT superfamily N-acetyltransferase